MSEDDVIDWLCDLPERDKEALTPDHDELLKTYRGLDDQFQLPDSLRHKLDLEWNLP